MRKPGKCKVVESVNLDYSKLYRSWSGIVKLVSILALTFTFNLYGIAEDTTTKDLPEQNTSGDNTDNNSKFAFNKDDVKTEEDLQKEQEAQKKKDGQEEADVASEASKAKAEIKKFQGVNTGKTADKKVFAKNMKELQNQRRKISLQMYQLRVKLIKEKPDLQILHRSVMDMHRRLAVEINSNQEMKKIILDAKKIDNQIMELIDNNNKNSDPELKTVKQNK